MSDAVGAISYSDRRRSPFLDTGPGSDRGPYAEETARLIDGEVKRLMTQAHEQARTLLQTHRDALERVTRRLLVIEVMEGAELRALLAESLPASHT